MQQLQETSPKKSSVLLKRLWHSVKPFWPVLAIGLAANMCYAGIDAGFTYMLKPFLNKSFIEKDMGFVQWIPLIILIGVSLRGVINSVAAYCMTWVARSAVKLFRQQVFQHLVNLPAKYYDQNSSGSLISKLLYDVEQIAQVSADALTTFVQSSFLVLGLLTVMFLINWQLTLFFLTAIPFVAIIVSVTNKKIRKGSHAVQDAMGDVTHIAEETIEGYRVVRLFGGQQYEIGKFNAATELSRKRDMKVALTKAWNVSGVQIVIAISTSILVLAAIKLSTVIVVTAGGFLSITAAMLQLIKPMKNLTTVNSVIQRGLAGAESIFDFIDLEVENDTGKQQLPAAGGAIKFNNLNFSYNNQSKNTSNNNGHSNKVLKDINLDIKPGEMIALVGRSGSGKTTLVSLLPRFYDVAAGQITIDGIDINELRLADLRSHISLVSQHITLFNDTIANNIAYGLFNKVSREQIEHAAERAHAMSFIKDLPQGLDTQVGENGLLLSGGQRQRIAIARAILKDAPILILDEATSALDTHAERHIQQALQEVMRGRTTIVVAHRLSTIESADRIVVLDEGRIVEQGSHANLLAAGGAYAALYRNQLLDSPVAQSAASSVVADESAEAADSAELAEHAV